MAHKPTVEKLDDGNFAVHYPDLRVGVGADQAKNETEALAVAEQQYKEHRDRQKAASAPKEQS